MAEFAVSPDGGNRSQYVLTRTAIALVVLMSTTLVACDSTDKDIETPASSVPQSAALQLLLDAQGMEPAEFGPLQFPLDSLLHPNSHAESIQLRAILYDESGASLGVSAQLARLALPAATTKVPVALASSEWSFRQIAFTDLQLKSSSELNMNEGYQRAQRVALGLAGSNEHTLWVGGDELLIDSMQDCERRYSLHQQIDARRSLHLQWSMRSCPDVLSLRRARQWSEHIVEVQATVERQENNAVVQSMALQGPAWITQSWGAAPTAGGAVIIDQLELAIENIGLIKVSRSKRRSGQGPKTVSAQWVKDHTGGDVNLTSSTLDMQWEDNLLKKFDEYGPEYPSEIFLSSSDGQLDWRITFMHDTSDTQSISGRQLTAAISVTGSHTGVGFLRYQALE